MRLVVATTMAWDESIDLDATSSDLAKIAHFPNNAGAGRWEPEPQQALLSRVKASGMFR